MKRTGLTKLIDSYSEAKKKFMADASELMKKEFKEFFKDVPEIKVIKWTQYTPYFNDGEPCVFSVNSPVFSNCEDPTMISVWGEIDGDEEDTNLYAFEGDYNMPEHFTEEQKNRVSELCEIIQSSEMEDVMLNAFGDHTEVTVTPKGIDVEEFQHD